MKSANLYGSPGADFVKQRSIPAALARPAAVRYSPRWYRQQAVLFPIFVQAGNLVAVSRRFIFEGSALKTNIDEIKSLGFFSTPGALRSIVIAVVEGLQSLHQAEMLSQSTSGYRLTPVCREQSERVANYQKDLRGRRSCENLCRPWIIWWSSEGELTVPRQVVRGSSRIAGRVVLRHILSVQFESDDCDWLSLREIGEEFSANCCGEVSSAIDERRPFGGEVVPQTEEQRQVGLTGLLQQVVQRALYLRAVNTLARGVADVQDHIRDRRVVESGKLFWIWEIQLPRAFRARALERQESLVTQVGLEHPAVIVRAARDDGLHRAGVIHEAVVFRTLPRVFAILGNGRLAQAALQQRERAIDARVRAGNRRDGKSDVLDAAHIMAWATQVVEPFGDRDLARAGILEREQGQGVELAKRDMARQLQLAFVVFVIRHLHSLDIQMQCLTRKQALSSTIPVVELHEVLGVQLGAHQFLFHRLLRLARGVKGEAVVLVIEPGNLALHPQIEFFIGKFVVQELIHFLRIDDLLLDAQIFVARNLLSD